MKAVMVMFDTLNRHMLPPYGCDFVQAPNFSRLAEHTVTFTKAFVGSMPCMPARRELHTGRYNFLHRSWGPLEPFDDSAIETMKKNNIYCHLTSDHPYYWQDGGATYHMRYTSYNHVRGQEGDPYTADVKEFGDYPPDLKHHHYKQKLDKINRKYILKDSQMPQSQVFQNGVDFHHQKRQEDKRFLHIETFDPHEPFFTLDEYKKLYNIEESKKEDDWPDYGRAEDQEEIAHMRKQYAALVSLCDSCLGRILDAFDRFHLWDDTMLIVNTDHGYMLGEHDYWAKNVMPWYNETANIPLFIWDPESRGMGVTNDNLVQTIDLPATLLEHFNIPIPADMQGRPLQETIRTGAPVREAALYGMFGGHINVTDGRYVYMRGSAAEDNEPLYQYTHMPTHLFSRFSPEEMRTMELQPPFSFTKGCPTMKIKAGNWCENDPYPCSGFMVPDSLKENLLFDLNTDPGQLSPLKDKELEKEMIKKLLKLMKAADAPKEQYIRMGLEDYENNI